MRCSFSLVSPASQALSDPKDTAAEDSVFAVTVDLTSGTTLLATPLLATGAWGCWTAPPPRASEDHLCRCPHPRRGGCAGPKDSFYRPALMIRLETSMSIHVPSIPTLDRVVSVVSARHPVLLRIQCLPGSPGSENLHPRAVLFKAGVHTPFSLLHLCGCSSDTHSTGRLSPTLTPPSSVRDEGD